MNMVFFSYISHLSLNIVSQNFNCFMQTNYLFTTLTNSDMYNICTRVIESLFLQLKLQQIRREQSEKFLRDKCGTSLKSNTSAFGRSPQMSGKMI